MLVSFSDSFVLFPLLFPDSADRLFDRHKHRCVANREVERERQLFCWSLVPSRAAAGDPLTHGMERGSCTVLSFILSLSSAS